MTLRKRIFGLGVGVVSAALFASSLASSEPTPASNLAGTTTLQQQVAVIQATCAGGAANATLDLTAVGNSSLVLNDTSPDTNYTCAGCKRYLVDVKFPAAYSKSSTAP